MMTENYSYQLERGLQFQDYVTDIIASELCINLASYSSKKYQLKGENKQGIEIKFDDRHKDTGNLYIEIAEKSNPANLQFVPSGIYRDDNSWLYVIGDYQQLFIFGKKTLVNIHKNGSDKTFKAVGNETSKGFLIPEDKIEVYALKILETKDTIFNN